MADKIREFLQSHSSHEVEWESNINIAQLTSFKIGGLVDFLVYPKSKDFFCALLSFLYQGSIKHIVVGRMSNVLFSDGEYHGVVICTSKFNSFSVKDNVISADCGANLSAICRLACDKALSGLEFAYGIPGSVGGAVFMNAGAYGGEIRFVVEAVEYYDPISNQLGKLTSEECQFGYRSSIFNKHPSWIVLNTSFHLQHGEKDAIHLKMQEILSKRVASQPLDMPNAGSTFKRCDGYIISKLIDEAGLKGTSIGGAEVSRKHAGFIVNTGKATTKDVCDLIAKIKSIIFEKHGIEIKEEIQLIE